MKYAVLTLVALFAVALIAGCGGEYQAPPKANARTVDQGGGDTGGDAAPVKPSEPEPTGPSYVNEFRTESKAALDAWQAWSQDKTPANYATVGEHLYNALRYKILHTRNGHSESMLSRVRELNRLNTDWRKTFQSGDWESQPGYEKAFEEYKKVQS